MHHVHIPCTTTHTHTRTHTHTPHDIQCGAISFIENISYENLRISEEEFNQNMGYVDGKTDTDLLLEEGDETEDRERIMILQVSNVHWVRYTICRYFGRPMLALNLL